jgi:hypothetical protein
MNRIQGQSVRSDLIQQGANSLLAATFGFLHRNNISKKSIVDFTNRFSAPRKSRSSSRLYSKLNSAHEEMGVIMAAWYSMPEFLDPSGNPIPLTKGKGRKSISHLIRASRAKIQPAVALQLMLESPSIKSGVDGKLMALRRVFVLPELEVPRAAFVVERFLDTLQNNAESRKTKGILLLERSCHVSEVDLSVIAPLLRDIEDRGTAFMDSIDGEIEQQRVRRERRKPARVGEMGVLVFAWTKPANCVQKRKGALLKKRASSTRLLKRKN